VEEYKKFVQRVGLAGITNILISLSGLIFIPIITKNFSSMDYGVWVQVNTTIALIPNIVNLGLPYTMVRFLSHEEDKNKIKESFYSMMLVTFVSGMIITAIMIIFANPIASSILGGNVNIAYVLAIISFLASINLMLLSFFRTFQQMKKYSLFLLLQTYIGVIIGSYFALSGSDLLTVVLAYSLGYVFVFIAMLIVIIWEIGIPKAKFKTLKEELNFAIPTIPNNISSWVVDSSDKYMIGIILSGSAVAYYSPSYALGSILLMFLSPFALLLPAILPKYYELGNHKEVNTFLRYSLKYFLVLAVPAAFGLSLLSKQLLLILTTPEIASNGYLVTPFICLGAIFMGMYGIINNIIILEKKTKILGSLWIIVSLLNIVFNIIVIPFAGIIGASFITLVCYGLAFLITGFYSNKYSKLPLPFDYSSIFKITLSSIIMSAFIIFANPEGKLNILAIIAIATAIYLIVLFAIKGIQLKEIRFFRSMLS